MLLRLLIGMLSAISVLEMFGQDSLTVDTSLLLETVVVKDSRLSLFGLGRKAETYDPTALPGAASIDALLSQQTLIHLKNYGPGQLSTTSFRGGSAGHTAIVWNGLNIDNTMLGQTDLAMLPASLFGNISVRYGGESTFWGSGAISGSIHLENDLSIDGASAAFFQQNISTIGGFETGWRGKISGKNNAHSVRIWRQHNRNDFTYTNDFGERLRLSNARFYNLALMQENRWAIGENQWINAYVWVQQTDRGIPPTKSQLSSQARQEDRALRVMAQWKRVEAAFSWEAQLAWMEESLDYLDPSADIFSENRIQTAIAQAAFTRQIAPRHLLQLNMQTRFPKIISNNYAGAYSESQWGLNASYRIDEFIKNWGVTTSIRQEWNGPLASPFLLSMQIAGRPVTFLQLRGGVSRNYRFPTFNDRFWEPGGTPDLKPEQGWSQEIGMMASAGEWTLDVTAFSRLIDNWIIWLPQGRIFSPQNIQRVWSRGVETRLQWRRLVEKKEWSISVSYDFVRSTNEKERFAGSQTLGKQLVYVPAHKGGVLLKYQTPAWKLAYRHNITGTVFTLSDHSEGLPPFQTGRIEAGYQFPIQKVQLRAVIMVENLWNEDYELVINRAMPGRYFQTSVQVDF